MSAVPRFVPMIGDGMHPGVRNGDLVAVLPVPAFRGAGLYVIEDALGVPNVVRAFVDGFGRLIVGRDNPASTAPATIGFDVFAACVLGKAFGICRITDRALLDDAGLDVLRPGIAFLAGMGGV